MFPRLQETGAGGWCKPLSGMTQAGAEAAFAGPYSSQPRIRSIDPAEMG